MYGISRSRSDSAMTSEPQPGVLAGVRLAGRSTSLREGWAAVEISAAGAALAVAVLTGQSLFWGTSRGHKIGSAGFAQPRQGPHARMAALRALAVLVFRRVDGPISDI